MRIIVILAALSHVASAARADEAPAGAYLRSAVYAGTLCPAGAVAATLSRDGAALDLDFGDVVVASGSAVPPSDRRRHCTLSLDVAVPLGYQYAILGAEYAGVASIAPRASVQLQSFASFQGQLPRSPLRAVLRGPRRGAFAIAADHPDAVVWSPCSGQRALTLSTSVAVSGDAVVGESEGLVPLSQTYALRWQRCR